MSGVKGRSGRRYQSKSTANEILPFAKTIHLRAMKDDSIPLIERAAKLAVPLIVKDMADKREIKELSVNLNINDAEAQAMLDEARRNLLIYSKLQDDAMKVSEESRTSDNINTSDNNG